MKNVINVTTREQENSTDQEIFNSLNKSLGFVPNLHAATGKSSNGQRTYSGYQNTRSSLSDKEKEAVNLVINLESGCLYCQSAHTDGFSEEQKLDLGKGRSENAKINALVQLAYDMTHKGGQNNPESTVDFYQQGYTDEHLVDLLIEISNNRAIKQAAQPDKSPWRFIIGSIRRMLHGAACAIKLKV